MTDNLLIGFIAAAILFFYAFLIWHAPKHGRSPLIYVLLLSGNITVALFAWNVITQPSSDPQAGMGLGLFLLTCAAISLALPFIGFVVFLFRLINKK